MDKLVSKIIPRGWFPHIASPEEEFLNLSPLPPQELGQLASSQLFTLHTADYYANSFNYKSGGRVVF